MGNNKSSNLFGVVGEALGVNELHAVFLRHFLEGAKMHEILRAIDDRLEGEVVFSAEDGHHAFRRDVAALWPVDGFRHLYAKDVVAKLVPRFGQFQSLHHFVGVGHGTWVKGGKRIVK